MVWNEHHKEGSVCVSDASNGTVLRTPVSAPWPVSCLPTRFRNISVEEVDVLGSDTAGEVPPGQEVVGKGLDAQPLLFVQALGIQVPPDLTTAPLFLTRGTYASLWVSIT